MPFILSSSSYDFPGKRISANLQKNDNYDFSALSINIPFDVPDGIKASDLEMKIKEHIRTTLLEAANFQDGPK